MALVGPSFKRPVRVVAADSRPINHTRFTNGSQADE